MDINNDFLEINNDFLEINNDFLNIKRIYVDYKIRKRLYSYNRLKKLLIKFDFNIIKKTGATFFFPKKNIFFYFWFILDLTLQKILDFKMIPFLINFSDNIVILAKKR